MDEREILGCIDAVAHGFEIVQSIFPDWRFQAADTVAAFALHGRLRHGPLIPTTSRPAEDWLSSLSSFRITLFRDDAQIDSGSAANVLGGPLSALRHMVRGMTEYPTGLALRTGDLVTTGTVTRAFPIAPGETWRTQIDGLPTQGVSLRFSE
jgi:2-oxo-3-hexenedioate decarboxylase